MARNEYEAHAHLAQAAQLPQWARPSTCKRPALRRGLLSRLFSLTR